MEQLSAQPAAMPGKVDFQQIDLLVRQFHALPTLPQVGARLLQLATACVRHLPGPQRDAANRQLLDHLRLDPVLTARALRDAARHTGRSVTTVDEAATAMGFETLRCGVLSLGVTQTTQRTRGALPREEFWRHSLAVATASRMLAAHLPWVVDADEAYVCGLLHDLGKLALAEAVPKSYARVLEETHHRRGNIADYERMVLGVDHAVFGRRLAVWWQLPQRVQETMWLHRQPVEALPLEHSARVLVALVGVADTLVRQAEIGYSGNWAFPRPAEVAARQIGLPAGACEEVLAELAGQVNEGCQRLGLDEPADTQAYYRALGQANDELGRLNQRLGEQTRQTSADARVCQLLRGFHSVITPHTTVDEALIQMAVALAQGRGLELRDELILVPYALNPQTHQLLALRCSQGGCRDWRSLALAPSLNFRRSDSAAAPAHEALPALLSCPGDLEDWLGGSEYVHQPLTTGGTWVGGVLLPTGRPDDPDWTARVCAHLADAMAMPLAMVLDRSRTMMLSEQLAGSSQLLADTQDQIAEAKTLASVGRMAAGAAHELNNPLAIVSGRAQLMAERAADEQDRRTWSLISEQAQRISDIVTELMEFANPPQPQARPVAAGELLREAAKSFLSSQHAQAAGTEIDIREEPALPVAQVDPEQIRQALVELLANAATAAGPGARLVLHARGDALDGSVQLIVEDHGPGMDEQTLAQVYTPFFSLQQAGRRRGLGLSRAKRLVESNGGRIWIRSRPGQGTTVHLQLPVSGEQRPSGTSEEGEHAPRTRGESAGGRR